MSIENGAAKDTNIHITPVKGINAMWTVVNIHDIKNQTKSWVIG